MSKIYTDLNTVLTPYATAIKKNASDITSLNGSLDDLTTYETIDLASCRKVAYNMSAGQSKWNAGVTSGGQSSSYGSALIPISDLGAKVIFTSGESYKCMYAFLKSDTMATNQTADFCDGQTTAIGVPNGESVIVRVPDDCEFLCIYLGNGNTDAINKGVIVKRQVSYVGTTEFDGLSNLTNNVIRTEVIDLSSYTPIPYHLGQNGIKWTASSVDSYASALVPKEDLASRIDLIAGETYYLIYAFLKSDYAEANQTPDFCEGYYSATRINGGDAKYDVKVPDDCEYLCVYLGKFNTDAINGGVIVSRKVAYAGFLSNKLLRDFKERTIDQIEIQYEEAMIRTLKHRHDGLRIGVSGTSMVSDDLLVLAHISDPHCDYPVYARFIEFLKRHTDTVSAGIVSGDFTTSSTEAQFNLMADCEDSSVNLIKCVGNHDVRQTDEETYALLNMDTNTGKLYYYVDYPQGIRVIVLFQYDIDDAGSSAIKDATANYSQVQIDWFISTLQDALINNLSVIIVMHGLEGGLMPTYNDKGFCADIDNGYGGAYNPSGCIIFDIVNAFKHGLAINRSYRNSTLTANTEFTSQGEFICYVAGHYHIDRIGYMSNYPDQLMCLIQICAIDVNPGFKRGHDTPRVKGTPTEDCINVYAFDTVSKLVKVARIGATYTDKFIERKCATFEY